MRTTRRTRLAIALGTIVTVVAAAGCNTANREKEVTREQVEKMELELEQAKRKLAEQQQPVLPQEQPAEAAPAAEPSASTPAPSGNRAVEPAPVVSKAPGAPAEPAKPRTLTIPAGTNIPVRTLGTLSTKTAENGSPFAATLDSDLVVGGRVVARKGADVKGIVVSSDPGGRVKGVASMGVTIRSIDGTDGPIAVSAGTYTVAAKKTVKNDAVKVGIASGVGAAIGAIAGGGKGAAIGAGAGAGAGTGAVLATRGEAAVLPSETRISFRTTAPATVRLD